MWDMQENKPYDGWIGDFLMFFSPSYHIGNSFVLFVIAFLVVLMIIIIVIIYFFIIYLSWPFLNIYIYITSMHFFTFCEIQIFSLNPKYFNKVFLYSFQAMYMHKQLLVSMSMSCSFNWV